MGNRRRALLAILFLVTVVVGAAAVYVGLQLQAQPDVTPDDTAAASACRCQILGCGNGCWQWNNCNSACSTEGGFNVTVWTCPSTTGSQGGNCFCDQDTGGTRNNLGGAMSGTFNVPQCGRSQLDIFTSQGIATGACFDFGFACGGGTTVPPTTNPPGGCIAGDWNVQFEWGDITSWFDGNTLTGMHLIAPRNIHIQCFFNGGAPPGGTSLSISGPGANGTVGGGTSNNYPFPQPGNFSVSCLNNDQVCNTDSFTLFTQTTTNTPTPTFTPTNTPTNTPTPSPTPTFLGQQCGDSCTPSAGATACPQDHTCVDPNNDNLGTCTLNLCVQNAGLCYSDGCTPVPDCGEPCDPSEGNNACSVDHQCVDDNDDGTGTCVLDQCADNPALCQPDQCTPLNEITVTKTAVPSCSSTGEQLVATYTIMITNPDAVQRTIDVVDDLSQMLPDATVQTSTISNGGVLAGDTITWTGLTLPASGNLTLTYDVVYTSATFNSASRNTVVVSEGGVERGRAEYTLTPFCLSGTALISDEVDRILIAVGLIFVGMAMYRLRVHYVIGDFLWNAGLSSLIGDNSLGNAVRKDKRKDFEEKALQQMSDETDS